MGNALCETQEFEQAVTEYYQAIEFEPNTDWLYPPLGKVLIAQQRWDQAIKVYCKAVELNSNNLWLLDQLAETLIEQQVNAEAKKVGGVAVIDPDLLDEVTALVEWPNALTGKFEERFLQVPAEALIASMKEHQKYFQ